MDDSGDKSADRPALFPSSRRAIFMRPAFGQIFACIPRTWNGGSIPVLPAAAIKLMSGCSIGPRLIGKKDVNSFIQSQDFPYRLYSPF
jgi:hypothetical protein